MKEPSINDTCGIICFCNAHLTVLVIGIDKRIGSEREQARDSCVEASECSFLSSELLVIETDGRTGSERKQDRGSRGFKLPNCRLLHPNGYLLRQTYRRPQPQLLDRR